MSPFTPPSMPPGIRRALRLPTSAARVAREVDDEMEFHIEMRVAALVAEGMSEESARAEALRRFGDPNELRAYCQSIEVPSMRRMHFREWLEAWGQDVRFAARQFRRAPAFVSVTVATLALGIGATTSIFSVISGVVLRALPYPEPDRIVHVWELDAQGNQTQVSDQNFADLAAQSQSFSAVAEEAASAAISVTGGEAPVRASVVTVTRDYFAVLGVRPILGRVFVPDEQRPGGPLAVVVSYAFWQRALGGSSDALSKQLRIGGDVYTVVGVMSPVMNYPIGVDVVSPRELDATRLSRTAHNWEVVARLKPGVTLDQARRDVTAIAKRLKQELGDQTDMNDVALVPLREQIVGSTSRALLVLLGASAVLLLIACANVVNLLVARMAARQGELALRIALGAARHRLVQQCLAESLMLSLAGGALGVGLAALGVKTLLFLQPGSLPRVEEVRVDWRVLLFTVVVSVVAALAMGLIAAWRGTRGDLREMLSQSQRSLTGAGSSERIRRSLVVAQVAMALVLLVGAGLLGRSFLRLMDVDPGFRRERAVVLDLTMAANDSAAMRQRVPFYDDLLARLAALPGVTKVGATNAMPLTTDGTTNGLFLVMARPDEQIAVSDYPKLSRDPARSGQAEFRVVSSGYFEAMGIPLVRGRLFDDRDAPHASHVAVISASLAKRKWPNEDPIGKLIQFGNMDGDLRLFTIVGIVGDTRQWGLEFKPVPTFYAYYRQRPVQAGRFNVVIATSGTEASVMASAQRAVRELRSDVPARVRSIESIVASSVADRRFVLFLVAVFGGAALVLATLGVYSVISYLVTQRVKEIGIRVALGAQTQDIVRLVLRQGTLLAAVGIVVGAAVAFAATRLLAGLLFEVSPTDPASFLTMMALLTAVALVASWLPARRAARVDAVEVLRGG